MQNKNVVFKHISEFCNQNGSVMKRQIDSTKGTTSGQTSTGQAIMNRRVLRVEKRLLRVQKRVLRVNKRVLRVLRVLRVVKQVP